MAAAAAGHGEVSETAAEAAAHIHRAHVGDGEVGGVNQGRGIGELSFLRGGNAAVQLTGEALNAQGSVFLERIDRLGELFVGKEAVFIGLHIRRDHFRDARDFRIQPVAFFAQIDKLLIDLMVQRGVFLAFEDP